MKNAKDRRENSLLEPDFIDSQMLWVMLRHLRADRRRRVSFPDIYVSNSLNDLYYKNLLHILQGNLFEHLNLGKSCCS